MANISVLKTNPKGGGYEQIGSSAAATTSTASAAGMADSLPPLAQKLLNAIVGGDAQTISGVAAKHPRIAQIAQRIAEIEQKIGQLGNPGNIPGAASAAGGAAGSVSGVRSPLTVLTEMGAMIKANGGRYITNDQQASLNSILDGIESKIAG